MVSREEPTRFPVAGGLDIGRWCAMFMLDADSDRSFICLEPVRTRWLLPLEATQKLDSMYFVNQLYKYGQSGIQVSKVQGHNRKDGLHR